MLSAVLIWAGVLLAFLWTPGWVLSPFLTVPFLAWALFLAWRLVSRHNSIP